MQYYVSCYNQVGNKRLRGDLKTSVVLEALLQTLAFYPEQLTLTHDGEAYSNLEITMAIKNIDFLYALIEEEDTYW